MPPWETDVAGHTLMWNVPLPAVVLPALLYAYPFVEQRLTGERRHEQHLCDRPRERPVRTGLGVAGITFHGVPIIAGGNDVVAPVVAFLLTRALCHALPAGARERPAEGEETGEVRQNLSGGYESGHRPVTAFRPGAPRRPLSPPDGHPGPRTGERAPEHPGPENPGPPRLQGIRCRTAGTRRR
ncbi:hypothetical protein [Streptomyces sp. NPDC047000]|uniref:hypothetical protein n=1 Tax=Streptomyces sp. NPDC047000 TaxID=3155474 RepID=UPI0033FF1E36